MSMIGRVARLAIRFNWSAKVRFVLLTLVVAIGMTVFLLISELSRVSSQDLDEAIAQDLGQTGTYTVDLPTDFGLGSAELGERLAASLDSFTNQPPVLLEMLPPVSLDCPPGTTLGQVPVMIATGLSGGLSRLPFGHPLPQGQQICIGGQEIPASAIQSLTEAEEMKWGSGMLVDESFARIASLNTTEPLTYRFVVVTDRQEDERAEIDNAVDEGLRTVSRRFGAGPDQVASVQRVDSADEIRRASAGVKLVYSIIAWGVLVLGALGLLVAEMIVVRDRTWFYGLARAVGGRSIHIAGLILADILLVLVAGTALSALLVAGLQPIAASFASSTLQVGGVHLFQPEIVPRLLVGELLVLILAGIFPALRAIRQDPLDVLEPSVV